MRRSRSIAKAAAPFIAGLLAGAGIAAGRTRWRPVSPLSADLPPDWSEASASFDRRVRIRFPAGTPVDRLARALDAEGFVPTWHESDGAYGAKRMDGSFPCRIVARVHWRVGNDDRITAVHGTYREEGCL